MTKLIGTKHLWRLEREDGEVLVGAIGFSGEFVGCWYKENKVCMKLEALRAILAEDVVCEKAGLLDDVVAFLRGPSP